MLRIVFQDGVDQPEYTYEHTVTELILYEDGAIVGNMGLGTEEKEVCGIEEDGRFYVKDAKDDFGKMFVYEV